MRACNVFSHQGLGRCRGQVLWARITLGSRFLVGNHSVQKTQRVFQESGVWNLRILGQGWVGMAEADPGSEDGAGGVQE